jgi:phage gpG-like protein
MKPRVSIDVKGVDKTIASLAGLTARAQTFNPVFIKAKEELHLANASNFTSNGLLVGGWAPLDASYAAWKLSRFPGAPPMVRTGRLFASLAGANASSFRMTNTSMSVGTTVEYAKFHQYGTSKMPKRKIVFEPLGFAKKVGNDAGAWVARGELF